MSEPTTTELEGIPSVGDLLGGRIRVSGVLGAGGMGVVLEGRHLDLERVVAIKMLKPSLAKEPDALTRFVREARAAASITSRHATRIFDVGTTEAGLPYITMERLVGKGLDALLEERGRLELEEAVRVVVQAAEAIAEANERGIIHRDLKPANLFLAEAAGDGAAPMVKVLDFGISKRVSTDLGVASTSLTAPHTILGSPQYMSPEQLRNARSVDERTDVWGLGVTLFELLTGVVPFASESIPELCALILTGDTPRATALRPDLPKGIDDVLASCLAKAADDRIPSVPALVAALLPFVDDETRPLAEAVAKKAKGGSGARPLRASRRVRPRSRWVPLLGGATVALAFVAVLVLGLRAGSAPPGSARAETQPPRAEPAPPSSAPAEPAMTASASVAPTPPASASASSRPPPPAASASAAPARVRDIRSIKLLD